MEYMAMLEEPGLVSGLQELIHDTEPSVVKRTIRVFTNVYRHSLSLLATGDLDPIKYEACYAEISMVSNDLIDMLKTADNEGIVVHLVRYLEAALVSHILSDLSQHPHIAQMTAPMLKKGVTALLDLVDTPYVGGTAFCVAIRALITVACYQVDMRPKITDVCESLIDSPPPNLFDHNVRSFHKTLQRNLFRLLKGEEEDAEKERLIDLMVRVGVPRKRLVEWGPRPNKKRPASSTRYDGKGLLSATKKIRLTEEQIIRLSPPAGTHSKIFSPPPSSSARKSPIVVKPTSEDRAPASISSILDQILSGDKVSDLNWLPPVKKTERKSIDSILKEKAAANRGNVSTPSPISDPLSTIRGILKLPPLPGVVSTTPGRKSPELKSRENSPKHSSGRNSPQESQSSGKSPDNPTCNRSSTNQIGSVSTSPSQVSSDPTSDLKPVSLTTSPSDSVSPKPDSVHNSPVHPSGRNSPLERTGRNSPKLIPLVKAEAAKATISFEPATFLVNRDQSDSDEQTRLRNNVRQQGFSPKESLIFEKLTRERVVEMLLTSTMNLPAEAPKYIPRINLEPLDIMREKLAILLSMYVPDTIMSQNRALKTTEVSNSTKDSSSAALKSDKVPVSETASPEITSMDSDPLFFSKDIDLRQSISKNSDVDMRNLPLCSDSRKSSAPFTSSQSKKVSDPRKWNQLEERHSTPANRDPRLASQSSSSGDPRLVSNRVHGIQGNPSNGNQGNPSQGNPSHGNQGNPSHGNQGNPSHGNQGNPSHGNQGNPSHGNPPTSSSDPRLPKAALAPVTPFPPLPPPPAVQSKPPPPPPTSRDPRLAARRSPPAPPVTNTHSAGTTPAVPGSYGQTVGTYTVPTTYPSHASYSAPNSYTTPSNYPYTTPNTYHTPASYTTPNTYPPPAPYGVHSSAPPQPSSRDPRLKAGPQGANSFPVLPSYPVRQPMPAAYSNCYAGLPNSNAYSGGRY